AVLRTVQYPALQNTVRKHCEKKRSLSQESVSRFPHPEGRGLLSAPHFLPAPLPHQGRTGLYRILSIFPHQLPRSGYFSASCVFLPKTYPHLSRFLSVIFTIYSTISSFSLLGIPLPI